MSRIIAVWVNCVSEDEAWSIADAAIGERLAASANVYPPIASAHHWQGAVERVSEVPLLMKTRAELFDALAGLVGRLHAYETPSVIGIPVGHATAAYEAWVVGETKEPV